MESAGDVLKILKAFHEQVIRPEMYHIATQVETALIHLDDRVNYVQCNLSWLGRRSCMGCLIMLTDFLFVLGDLP